MNDTLIDQIIRHEGRVVENGRHIVYIDSLNNETIGYGRLLSRGLSESEARFLLTNDVNTAMGDCIDRFPWFSEISMKRQSVLINMCFNIGINRLLGFKNMIAAIEAQDWDLAAEEMLSSKWARQVKGRAIELSDQMRAG